jgi:hypothetical protein
MHELDSRLRSRLRALADAVPVSAQPVHRVPSARPVVRSTGFSPLLAGAAVIAVAVLSVILLGRAPGPATTTTSPAPGIPSPSPSQAAASPSTSIPLAAGAQLRVEILVEEGCPQTEGGTCRYAATLAGPDGQTRSVPTSGDRLVIEPGGYRLAVEARLGTDVAGPGPGPLDASCGTTFTAQPGGRMIVARAVFRRGSCVVQIDDGQATPSPAATRPPADLALPYPEGCPAYNLSTRRCAYVVDWALAQAGLTGQPAGIELLGDPACVGKPAGCIAARTTVFVVRVRVTPVGGEPSDHPVFCGVGGETSMLCTDTPLIRVASPMSGYHDVPCGAEPAPGNCASPVPTIAPSSAAKGVPLSVPSLTIAIDHVGAYAVDIGDAVLPNGILTEASATLADDRRADVLIPEGIQLEVVGEDGQPLVNAYDHGWRPGTEQVHIRLVFTVESFDPGATLEITEVVVR